MVNYVCVLCGVIIFVGTYAKGADLMGVNKSIPDKKGCMLCPRECMADRAHGETGYCGMPMELTVARAALHFWEEPCITGKGGSGTVFFSGCTLRCVFCQNYEIAAGTAGKRICPERLTEIFWELKEQGAENINLVTAGHFLPLVIPALSAAKARGLERSEEHTSELQSHAY